MVTWSALVFTILRADYADYLYLRGDLGNMTQAVWSTAHGRPLEMTDALGEQVSRLAFHVDPILVLLAPLWLLMPTPLSLAGVQVATCALGALPVFWLARRHVESQKVAALLAISYLVYPWTAWNVLDAMHPVTLAMPLLLFALWFLDSGRLGSFAMCAVLVVLCGELMGLVIASLGVWYWLVHRRRVGLAILAGGLAWSAFAVKILVPLFAGGPSVYQAYFDSVGGSPEGVMMALLTDPSLALGALLSGRDLAYLFFLFGPLLALPVLAPAVAAIALPLLLANTLSDRLSSTDPRAHYSSVVIAMLFAASVFGVARLPCRHRLGAAAAVLGLSATASILMGLPTARASHERAFINSQRASRADALRAAVALVPANAAVSSTSAAGSHLSARRHYYQVPIVGRADWIVVELRDASVPGIPVGFWSPAELRRFVARISADPSWRKVFSRDGVFVFSRVGSLSVT